MEVARTVCERTFRFEGVGVSSFELEHVPWRTGNARSSCIYAERTSQLLQMRYEKLFKYFEK